MIDLNEFKKEVHENLVKHGFWDGEYSDAVAISLIHAEISEVLEEWRDNSPMEYYICDYDGEICDKTTDCAHYDGGDCAIGQQQPKPYGVAVELIDVVLRILDTAAAWDVDVDISDCSDLGFRNASVPQLVACLHQHTSEVYERCCSPDAEEYDPDGRFATMVCIIFEWLRAHGVYPEPLMRRKHEYNQTRAYKHGGKRI